ncbi:MAG: J domain-containing protein [Alphaproteobacteria bacterium]|nr:J domain-containing protein [Alphaproteobacteria bacterium]
MNINKDYYTILGIPPEATTHQLKAAFRALVKRYHPDTTSLRRRRAETRFHDVNEAYRVLSDPGLRRVYDMRRRAAASRRATRAVELDPSPGVETQAFTDLEVDALAHAALDTLD